MRAAFCHNLHSWRFADARITSRGVSGKAWSWTPYNANNRYGLAIESWFRLPDKTRERIRFWVTL